MKLAEKTVSATWLAKLSRDVTEAGNSVLVTELRRLSEPCPRQRPPPLDSLLLQPLFIGGHKRWQSGAERLSEVSELHVNSLVTSSAVFVFYRRKSSRGDRRLTFTNDLTGCGLLLRTLAQRIDFTADTFFLGGGVETPPSN